MSNQLSWEEIKSIFSEENISVEEFALGDLPEAVLEKVGPVQEVAHYGGEGQGEDWWSIFYFKNHNLYIRVEGYYQSYCGEDFSDSDFGSEVKPTTKTIVTFE